MTVLLILAAVAIVLVAVLIYDEIRATFAPKPVCRIRLDGTGLRMYRSGDFG